MSSPAPLVQRPFFARARAAAAAAEKGNLIINPVSAAAATITSPASAPSTAGFTNITPVSTGFASSFTGNTTAGSNVITGVTSTGGLALAKLSAGMFLVENVTGVRQPADIPTGTTIFSVDTVGATITMSAPATGSASVTVYVATDLLDYIGGVPALANGNMTVSGASVTSATPSNSGAPYAVEFWTDAASVTTASAGLIFAFYQNGVTPNSYRIAIDNVYQTAAPQAFPNSGGNWITVQFASAGTHLVRLELTGGYLLQQTYAINSASIWKSNSAADIRAGMFGDSWFQNAAAGSWGARNIPHTLGLLMGWKPDCIAQGGTGYVNTGGTNFAWTDTHRSTYDIKRRAYDVLVFFGSINDNAAPLTTLYSAALQTWQQARAANPTAPIFVFGVPTTGTVLNATAVAMEGGPTSTAGTTLYQAFAAWGDGNSYFIPISSDLAGAWLTAANQSIYIYSGDNNHPLDPTGALYVAQRMAAKIKALLAAGPSI